MPISPALRRLLHVRETEEEQHRLALQSALGELRALETALAAAQRRRRDGKALLVRTLAETGVAVGATVPLLDPLLDQVAAHIAAQVEIEAAARCSAVLEPRIAAAEMAAAHSQRQYLEKRLERRQAQTLIEEACAREEGESRRRSQLNLDDAFIARRHSRRGAEKREDSPPAREPTRPRLASAGLETESDGEPPVFPPSGSKFQL